MKQFLILISTVFLFNCNKKKPVQKIQVSKPIDSEEVKAISKPHKIRIKQDTTYNYWALILDTVTTKKQIKNSGKNYTLALKTYSLNDSAIVRNLEGYNGSVYVDYSHTMITDINFIADSLTVKKRIDRTTFKNFLEDDFYNNCNLFSTEIDTVVKDTIFLISEVAVPDSDNQWAVWYYYVISKNTIDSLKVKDVDYIGL